MMRRWRTILIAAIIGGLTINVGICWRSAYYSKSNSCTNYWNLITKYPNSWHTRMPIDWPMKPNARLTRVNTYNTLIFETALGDSPQTQLSCITMAYGWPLRAMTTQQYEFSPNHTDTPQASIFRAGFEMNGPALPVNILEHPMRGGNKVNIPLRPRPIPFAANWIIYTFILLTPCLVLSLVRKKLRRDRGLCRKCGYEIADLDICPECGLPAEPRTMPQ